MAYYPTIEREIVGRGIKNTIIHMRFPGISTAVGIKTTGRSRTAHERR